jgi:hypothetical protein
VNDRPQYDHDAGKGETRYPPQEGEQYRGRPGERDPHSRLNTPLSELDRQAEEERVGDGRLIAASMEGAAAGSDDDSPEGGRADKEEREPVESTREVEDGEAEEALRRAQDEAGGTIERDR